MAFAFNIGLLGFLVCTLRLTCGEYYAPYVHVKVTGCAETERNSTMKKLTCSGFAPGGFAVSDDYTVSDMCSMYCIDEFTTLWSKWVPISASTPTIFLGGSPQTLPDGLCVATAVNVPCYSRVSETTPINDLSISVYAPPDIKKYYFSTEHNATCTPSVQCSAVRLIKQVLKGKQSPDVADVNNIRGTRYSCILTYIGVAGISGADVCFEQLGPSCFRPGNLTELCILGENSAFGITNSGAAGGGSLTMCSFNNAAKTRKLTHRIDPTYVPYGVSACSAMIIDPESYTNTAAAGFSIEYDPAMITTFNRYTGTFLSVPVSCDMITNSNLYVNMANTITGMLVVYSSTGVVLDMSDITSTCFTTVNAQTMIGVLLTAISKIYVYNIVIKLPVNIDAMKRIPLHLDIVTAGIVPADKLTVNQLASAPPALDNLVCQTPWETANANPGLLAYMLAISAKPAKVIVGIGLDGYVSSGSSWYTNGGSNQPGLLLLADAVTQNLQCSAGKIGSGCCTATNSVPVGSTTTTVNSAYMKVEDIVNMLTMVNGYFGINQFAFFNADSDYIVGREALPAIQQFSSIISGMISLPDSISMLKSKRMGRDLKLSSYYNTSEPGHARMSRSVTGGVTTGGDQSNSISPKYRVGNGPTLVCPGMIATVGSIYVTNIQYREFQRSNIFDQIYVADISTLTSCTIGAPASRLPVSESVPQYGIDVNTFVPSVKKNAYIVGISVAGTLVEYIPPVQAVCQDVNNDPIDRLPFITVDDIYVYDEPTVENENNRIIAPIGIHYIMSDWEFGIDYINFQSVCIDYDIDAMPSCGITVCGGDLSCINTYGGVCNAANTIISDARRSGQLMRNAFDELAIEEKKAMVYIDPNDPDAGGRMLPPDAARFRRSPRIFGFIGIGLGIAGIAIGTEALNLAKATARRVDVLEQQLDLTKNQIVELGNQLVTITSKLNQNIEMTNQRIDDLQDQTNQQFKTINNNFQQLSADLKALQTEVNTRFKVMFGYQTWYSQMISITTQLTQAAIQMNYKTANIKVCLLNLAEGRMGVCPSGLDKFVEYPGLSNVKTVQGLLYSNRRLIIINKFPKKIEGVYMHKVVGIPRFSNGIPCWPNYDAVLVNGEHYHEPECESRFCNTLEPYPEFTRCLSEPARCDVVCSECYKNICWKNGAYVWNSSTIVANIPSIPPPVFERPEFNMTFPDLNLNLSDPDIVEQLNTSIVLIDIRDDLENVNKSLERYIEEYNKLTARRTTTDTISVVLVGVTIAWLIVLTIVLLYYACCKKNNGAGGSTSVTLAGPAQLPAPAPAPQLNLQGMLGAAAALPILPPQARLAAAGANMLMGSSEERKPLLL